MVFSIQGKRHNFNGERGRERDAREEFSLHIYLLIKNVSLAHQTAVGQAGSLSFNVADSGHILACGECTPTTACDLQDQKGLIQAAEEFPPHVAALEERGELCQFPLPAPCPLKNCSTMLWDPL